MIVRVLLALVTCTTGTSLLGRGAPATTAALVDERAVLKELFTATGGAKWLQSAGWLDDGTGKEHNYYYCTWQGIFCNDQHQVMSIQLASNGLMHGLPSSLYTLPALQTVNLRGNPLTDVGLENATTIASPLTVLDLTDTLIRDVQGVGAAAKTLQVFKLSRSSGNLYDWSSVSMGSSRAAGAGRTFPSVDVTKLTNLHTLHMFDCGYTGTLPLEIGKLTALQELFLQGNELSGSIPDAIGQSCRQLRILSLSDNRWTGTIPLTLCDLANLELLNLQGRGGGGTATSLLSSMSSSSKVGLLTGPLPSLPLATHLRHIFLDYNGLTGSIPETFLQSTDEAKPVTVQLEFNQLTGTIPAVLSRFIALNLQLSGNAFIGPTLPSAFCSASAWMMGAVGQYGCDAILCRSGTFNTDGKQISDNEPCLPCPTMSHSTVTTSATETTAALQLGATDCVSAFTSGDPTAQQERQVRILAEFYLALSGPNEWSNRWTGLDALLADVGLEDGAADSLSSMEDIRVVVDGLNVTSVLSAVCQWYGILCNENGFVEIITLPNNHMVGVIPDTFFQFLPNLKSIDLSNNRIQVADFSALQYASSLSRLRLSNTAVQNLAGLSKAAAHLHELLLDGCNFDGAAISTELYQLTNLLTLHLEASFLAGNIPAEIRQLTNLQRYDIEWE